MNMTIMSIVRQFSARGIEASLRLPFVRFDLGRVGARNALHPLLTEKFIDLNLIRTRTSYPIRRASVPLSCQV